ncbi:MAG: acyl-CoA dehydrogenase family protein [Alphaproteobacteria bacterium]
MSSEDNMIVDAATRIFMDMVEAGVINAAETGTWPQDLWNTLEESGLTLAWGDDEKGGAGVDMLDGFALIKTAGQFSVPVPMAETLMAAWLLGHGKLDLPMGPMTIAPTQVETRITISAVGALAGTARYVPFGRNAEHVAVLARAGDKPVIALVKRADCTVRENINLAGEPADDISFDGAKAIAMADAPDGMDESAVFAMGATVRSMQMAGGLEKVLDQSVQYSLERSQFGRPIGKFQAVQHSLAQLAGETAAAGAAADAAAEAIAKSGGLGDSARAEVAAAKSRVGEAATTGAAIAHQTHGAMGFTYEHTLHHATRRLWSWRDEFGNESYWAIQLGRMVAARGADNLWPFVTGD